MRWHLAAVQACTSFSIITEKREAQAALEGDGRTDGCPLLSARSTGSLLQPPGDRDLPEITARKTELWTAPVQAIGSLFLPPKAHPSITSEQTARMQMWSQPGIFCAWHKVCAQTPSLRMHSLTSGNKRSIFWQCESNTPALHGVSDTFSHSWLLLPHCSNAIPSTEDFPAPSQLQAVAQWPQLSPGSAECIPSLPGNGF